MVILAFARIQVSVFREMFVLRPKNVATMVLSMCRCVAKCFFYFVILLVLSPGCETNRNAKLSGDVGARVIAFCGACHNMPDPATLPRDAWFQAVQNGFDFYHSSGRTDLQVPALNDVVQWFRERAAEDIDIRPLHLASSPIRFRPQSFGVLTDYSATGASVSHVLVDGDGEALRVLVGDMKNGAAFRLDPRFPLARPESFVSTAHPAGMAVCDLDADGGLDLVVANLGSFQPLDHSQGAVTWVRLLPDGTTENRVILDGVGRVSDVRPADFDGDGDIDLVVAEFGWRKTGRVLILWQHYDAEGVSVFTPEVVDERHGAIHVPVVDIDKNGHLDFLVLFSQEFEEVDAFLNLGGGRFERQVVFMAGDPGFGSSGIDLVDVDQDGDLDVLYTNGDTLDTKRLKSCHGVHWLENRGDFPFDHHELMKLPGASRARAADVDADGDVDVVAVAWIPDIVALSSGSRGEKYHSLVWIEQVHRGVFEAHDVASQVYSGYLTLDVADLDGDGDVDFAAGCFGRQDGDSARLVDIFWNENAEVSLLPFME